MSSKLAAQHFASEDCKHVSKGLPFGPAAQPANESLSHISTKCYLALAEPPRLAGEGIQAWYACSGCLERGVRVPCDTRPRDGMAWWNTGLLWTKNQERFEGLISSKPCNLTPEFWHGGTSSSHLARGPDKWPFWRAREGREGPLPVAAMLNVRFSRRKWLQMETVHADKSFWPSSPGHIICQQREGEEVICQEAKEVSCLSGMCQGGKVFCSGSWRRDWFSMVTPRSGSLCSVSFGCLLESDSFPGSHLLSPLVE